MAQMVLPVQLLVEEMVVLVDLRDLLVVMEV